MTFRLAYFAFAATCFLYAWWKGGAPERWGAALLFAGSIATPLVRSAHTLRYHGWEPQVGAVDAILLLALLGLTAKADRYWPIWLTAIHLCSVMSHLMAAADREIVPTAYYIMIAFGSYPAWLILVVAAKRHEQRLRYYGSDRAWRGLSPDFAAR